MCPLSGAFQDAFQTRCHAQQGVGDVLIFLTGREEIDRCLEELSEMIPSCVYSTLSFLRYIIEDSYKAPP